MGIVFLLLAIGLPSCESETIPSRSIGISYGVVCNALRVCADGATVPGIDVSKWQGAIDWPAVQESGVVFAFIRVSHGINVIDEYFVDNWAEAAEAGILRGAYQYFSPDQDPIAQADVLLERLETYGAGELPPVIDVEETSGESAATIATRVGQWLDHVESELGVRPIIYTGSYFWNTSVQSNAYADFPLWIANWGVDCPNLPTAWSDWVFWQTSATGRIPGISGNVDTDVFNGDLDALLEYSRDPDCTAIPDLRTCVGDVLRLCDETGHLISVDCPESSQVCSSAGVTARCVDPECAQDPDSGAAGAFCLDGERLGQCTDGALSVTDCSLAGQVCLDSGTAALCSDSSPDPLDGSEEPSPDSGPYPDAGEPDMGGSDLGPDESGSPGTDTSSSQEFGRFVQVGDWGLDGGGCEVTGTVSMPPSLFWVLLMAAVWMGKRRLDSP